MSAADTYKIVIHGTIAPGQDLKQVQDTFCDMFRVSPEQFKEFFRGKPRVIKEGLTAASASIYLNALENIGLESKLVHQDTPEGTEEAQETTRGDDSPATVTPASGNAHPQALVAILTAVIAGGALWQLLA